MNIVLRDRTNRYPSIYYARPLSIVVDKAINLYCMSDVTGNGMQPDDMLLAIRLPDGEMATFTAEHWEVIFIQEA